MSLSCILLNDITVPCGYFEGHAFTSEHYMIGSIDNDDLDSLLEAGYRHFGCYFFRPVCTHCHRCVPIRVLLPGYKFPRSARRLFNRNSRFRTEVTEPRPSGEAFELYRLHKKRFGEISMEHYDQFVESFFYHFSSSYQLSVFDGDKLICVSHFDMTDFALSAIYCYFDDTYAKNSLGSFAIYKEIELGLQNSLQYLYLGYFIRENRHMSYKANYRPNQVCLREGKWADYRDKDNNLVYDGREEPLFYPQTRLIDPRVKGGMIGESF